MDSRLVALSRIITYYSMGGSKSAAVGRGRKREYLESLPGRFDVPGGERPRGVDMACSRPQAKGENKSENKLWTAKVKDAIQPSKELLRMHPLAAVYLESVTCAEVTRR